MVVIFNTKLLKAIAQTSRAKVRRREAAFRRHRITLQFDYIG
ncbi:MAG: hypothetical protein RMX68_025550 [Aulosira sp. ZfuVER01]|nr:hypothetical protein [Aulosira sp. DedVER01a]MDZ8053263.1 hypothetical protein [Aulosira sp. ZfuCHP01]